MPCEQVLEKRMSLRQKTISGAKWSAIATIVIIGLGLI
ncbi:hypothetical protein ACV2E0_23705, partial [Salmonella enterica subsp. enterica serovar Infantis]